MTKSPCSTANDHDILTEGRKASALNMVLYQLAFVREYKELWDAIGHDHVKSRWQNKPAPLIMCWILRVLFPKRQRKETTTPKRQDDEEFHHLFHHWFGNQLEYARCSPATVHRLCDRIESCLPVGPMNTTDNVTPCLEEAANTVLKDFSILRTILFDLRDERIVHLVDPPLQHPQPNENVYMICINSVKKTITVSFRGCAHVGNVLYCFTKNRMLQIPNPTMKKATMGVHAGTCGMLVGPEQTVDATTVQKSIETILAALNDIQVRYNANAYEIMFTGHSLGGTLAHLVSLFAACDDRFHRCRIRVVAIAPYQLGNEDFVQAFGTVLRTGGITQSLRFANSLDPVANCHPLFTLSAKSILQRYHHAPSSHVVRMCTTSYAECGRNPHELIEYHRRLYHCSRHYPKTGQEVEALITRGDRHRRRNSRSGSCRLIIPKSNSFVNVRMMFSFLVLMIAVLVIGQPQSGGVIPGLLLK